MPAPVGKQYTVIYADPPWPEDQSKRHDDIARDGDHRARRGLARSYYDTMTANEILSMAPGIAALTAESCALFLWSTTFHLPLALRIVAAWGFEYVNIGFTWMKRNRNAGTPFVGLGYYTRGNAELCLLGRIGHPRPICHGVASAVYEPRSVHSRKPDEVRRRIELLFGDVPRIELFARERHRGWDAWGDEVKCSPAALRALGDPQRRENKE